LGRLRAELEFADAAELCAGDLDEVLVRVEEQVQEIATATASECFLYRVDLDMHALQLMPGSGDGVVGSTGAGPRGAAGTELR
jgi:hypothetical protein